MSLSLSSVLLISYISCETVRANYAYYAFHNYPLSPSVVALLSEALKLAVPLFFIARKYPSISALIKAASHLGSSYNDALGYALPASLYLINNLIYMSVLPLTSPSLLQVCVLAKLPATGILHHYMIKPQPNVYAWLSLLSLCIGLVIFNIPKEGQSAVAASAWYIAPIAGGAISVLSAIASISSERLIKTGDFWVSQSYLYTWGVIFSVLSFPVMGVLGLAKESKANDPIQFDSKMLIAASLLITITAGTGLVVAILLRQRDNILKVIGTSASLVTIAASQFMLYPELRASNFTSWKVCGGGIVGVSTWCYNFWNQAPWPPAPSRAALGREVYMELGSQDLEENDSTMREHLVIDEKAAAGKSIFDPDSTKIIGCALVIAFVWMEMSRSP